MKTKQVIVMRKDLNMRKGKMVAQGSHGSMAFITRQLQKQIKEYLENPQPAIYMEKIPFTVELSREEMMWILDNFAKICVSADSQAKLAALETLAQLKGLTVHQVTDNGLTEFHGVPTDTCIAIGPHEEDKFIGVTDDLPLL